MPSVMHWCMPWELYPSSMPVASARLSSARAVVQAAWGSYCGAGKAGRCSRGRGALAGALLVFEEGDQFDGVVAGDARLQEALGEVHLVEDGVEVGDDALLGLAEAFQLAVDAVGGAEPAGFEVLAGLFVQPVDALV